MEKSQTMGLMEAYASIYEPREEPQELNENEIYNAIGGYLMAEGFAETEDAAVAIMANMSEQWMSSIFEGLFDFLPKSKTVVLPQGQQPDKRGPLQKYSDATRPLFRGLPKSKVVDANTAFKAGGGNAKMKETGMSRAEVQRLGAKNMK